MDKILESFEQALLSLDRIEAHQILLDLTSELDKMECIEKIVAPTLERIGLQWERGDIALSQVYMSGRICEELVDFFLPPASPDRIDRPNIAIAILDDFHSLGKSIIYSALRARGIELQDFGTVDIDTLITKTIDNNIRILLISVLMYSSAQHIREVCNRLRQQNIHTRIIVGGAPFRFDTDLWKTIGADAVGTNTAEAIDVTMQMIEGLS